jgi:hypothetical protein
MTNDFSQRKGYPIQRVLVIACGRAHGKHLLLEAPEHQQRMPSFAPRQTACSFLLIAYEWLGRKKIYSRLFLTLAVIKIIFRIMQHPRLSSAALLAPLSLCTRFLHEWSLLLWFQYR